MINGLYDMYIRDDIMAHCDEYFNNRLKEEDAIDEKLTAMERELVYIQIDIIIDMIGQLYKDSKDEDEALTKIIDHLIGFCIVGKMNETRLCRLFNECMKED